MKQRALYVIELLGLTSLEPVVRLLSGENPREQFGQLAQRVLAPLVALAVFLLLWHIAAASIVTKYGTLPNPAMVAAQAGQLVSDHFAERSRQSEFEAEQRRVAESLRAEAADLRAHGGTEARIALLERKAERAAARRFSGNPTYLDQIGTSLKTVFTGFLLASLIAIPLGILCGLSRTMRAALDPLIQIFKPVSPLAWLPIVMIVVGATYTTPSEEAWFEKSFISSAFTVALCCMWPTLVNTALGVASLDQDYLNVAKVLGLSNWTTIRKIVIPAALPYIFAGLRISLGVGWMVLIAAEMLAQNPGLGKFVWDMFQNGSAQTLAQIMVAVFTIGAIGFALDHAMTVLQRAVSWGDSVKA